MRRSALPCLVLSVLCAAQGASPAGRWKGALELPSGALGFEVTLEGGAGWKGTISIPAQGVRDMALADVRVSGLDVSFRMPGIPGDPTFRARLKDGILTGTLTQGAATLPFRCERAQAAPAPAPPTPPAGVQERKLTVGEAALPLPATLSLPAGKGPWPVLVLVHGSGPHDEDETIGPNAPFRDLAWGLARRGVAVLRYVKRTRAHPGSFAQGNVTLLEETVADAALAVQVARALPACDGRVMVLGHSLGGACLGRIGARAPFLSGLVSLAGPTRPMGELILEQMRHLGAGEAALRDMEARVARVAALRPGLAPTGPLPLDAPASWWLDVRSLDPATEAARLGLPLLILQGGRDYQVTDRDLEGWKRALEGRGDATIRRFPALNHLFMAGTGTSLPAEYERPGHVDPAVVDAIADWALALTPSCGPGRP